jgi:hypothetical protein
MDPRDIAKQQNIERIRRMGGVASAFALPARPVDRHVSDVSVERLRPELEEFLEKRLESPPAFLQKTDADPLVSRLENLEKTIAKKLDLLSGGGQECQAIISGVASLAAQVKQKEEELEKLRREVGEERARPIGQVEIQMLETVKKENESVRKSNAGAERSLKDSDEKVRELEGRIAQQGGAAQARTKTLVKRLMENVFQDMNELFEPKKQYSGGDVSKQLWNLLRKHSFTILKDIQDNGLF